MSNADGSPLRVTSPFRHVALAVVGTALSMALNTAPTFAGEGHARVHTGDRDLKALMERGAAGSETFRSLLDQLDAAPIQVFARCDSFMPDGLAGRLDFVASVGGVRYVRVAIRCTFASRQQLSFLAHELQHALEIANNPDIADADSMESYYAAAGFQTHIDGVNQRGFETDAAIAVQHRVDHELSDRPSRNDDARTGQRSATP